MRGPRCSHLLLLAALAGGAQAADPAAAPPVPTEDSITAAKRQFEAIKSARAPAEQQRLDVQVQGVTAPPPQMSNDELTAFLAMQAAEKQRDKEKAGGKAKRSSSWLLDAMNEQKTGEKDKDGTATLGTGSDEVDPAHLALAGTTEASVATESKRERAAKPPVNADNPLSNYMAGWMTPRDYDVLKVKPADNSLAPIPEGTTASRGGDPANLDSLLRGESVPPPAPLANPAGETKANPYVADFGPIPGLETVKEAPGPAAPGLPSFGPVAPANTTVRVDQTPPPEAPPPADPLKPSSDAKYFKQLKRF